MRIHWHVATGLAGYGPDASDTEGFAVAWSASSAADMAVDEIRRSLDMLADTASNEAEQENYKEAWDNVQLSQELDIIARNLSSERASAPLYVGTDGKWELAVADLLGSTFPLDLDTDGRSRLYVWQCQEFECMSLEDIELDAGTVVEAARRMFRTSDVSSYRRALADLTGELLGISSDSAVPLLDE